MVLNMRKLVFLALLAFLPAHADETQQYRDWLEFKKAFAAELGGPTGIYAIQDMVEVDPGGEAWLPSGNADGLRWATSAPGAPLVHVQFEDGRARIQGSGIEARDLLRPVGEPLALPNGLAVRGTLLREKVLKLWLYNPKLPARKGFEGPDYYPYDPRGLITGSFRPNEKPTPVSYLDSRQQAGTMYVVGTVQAKIGGKTYDLKTYSYRSQWDQIGALLLLLRDGTSGRTTYEGGRVVDIHIPKGAPPQTVSFDLNTAYSFLCAHSGYFNCPLVLTNNLDAELTFGEKHPPRFAAKPASR